MSDDYAIALGKMHILQSALDDANDYIDELRAQLRYAVYRIKQLEDERDGVITYEDP